MDLADNLPRSPVEIYSFATKHQTLTTAVGQGIEMMILKQGVCFA